MLSVDTPELPSEATTGVKRVSPPEDVHRLSAGGRWLTLCVWLDDDSYPTNGCWFQEGFALEVGPPAIQERIPVSPALVPPSLASSQSLTRNLLHSVSSEREPLPPRRPRRPPSKPTLVLL